MGKSPLSKDSDRVKIKRSNNIDVSSNLTIPYQTKLDKNIREFDISHLEHQGCDKSKKKIVSRIPHLKSFCQMARKYVANGNSAKSISNYYDILRAYIFFCDAVHVDPFTEQGYLKYCGNDGELRHQIKVYDPSRRLWEKNHGDELGIKESSASCRLSALHITLTWCRLPSQEWKVLHRSFGWLFEPHKAYFDNDEEIIVSRLSSLFFGLASQLIAIKKENLVIPERLPVSIDFGEHRETLLFKTDLSTKNGSANKSSAFNITMSAAYHLMCYFTSLNDSVIREISHPITIHTDSRDKSLKITKVSGTKVRANKEVDAILTDETSISFDVNKKSGVLFIQTLEELSTLYGGKQYLIFLQDKNGRESDKFQISECNKHLVNHLNLVSSQRDANLPWFKELFYSFINGENIELKSTIDELGRRVVSKVIVPIIQKSNVTTSLFRVSYCILSCYTDKSLKGILLPLKYSNKDKEGNITVSFSYQNGDLGAFIIPAADKVLIEDIEEWATKRADKQFKPHPRYLLKVGNYKHVTQWEGFSPISSNLMRHWGIETDQYFIAINSSRFRKTTSLLDVN
jgi:hypothetical protein